MLYVLCSMVVLKWEKGKREEEKEEEGRCLSRQFIVPKPRREWLGGSWMKRAKKHNKVGRFWDELRRLLKWSSWISLARRATSLGSVFWLVCVRWPGWWRLRRQYVMHMVSELCYSGSVPSLFGNDFLSARPFISAVFNGSRLKPHSNW